MLICVIAGGNSNKMDDKNTFSYRKWKNQVYDKALKLWGKELQVIMGIEEMAELTKELSKEMRGKGRRNKLIEEIADVFIMLEQLIRMFDCNDEFQIKKHQKFKRLDDMTQEKYK